MLSPILGQLKPSPTLYINETVRQRWDKGETVYHLGFGESRFDVHPLIQDALKQQTHQKSYLPARGLPALCDAVADYYQQKLNHTFNTDQVVIGPGSKALIYALQMALDADLILPTPSRVSYAPQAELLSRPVHFVPASAEDG